MENTLHAERRIAKRTGEQPPDAAYKVHTIDIKVIRKFFINHNKSFIWHLGDYEKHIFSHLKACERRNFDFCVFLRMCSGSC